MYFLFCLLFFTLVEFETSLHIFSVKDYMYIVLNNST